MESRTKHTNVVFLNSGGFHDLDSTCPATFLGLKFQGTKEAAHSASNDPTWCTDVMRSREKSDCQEWGVAIEDPEETFKAIDKDKGGQLLVAFLVFRLDSVTDRSILGAPPLPKSPKDNLRYAVRCFSLLLFQRAPGLLVFLCHAQWIGINITWASPGIFNVRSGILLLAEAEAP